MAIRIVGTLQPVRTNVRTRYDPVKGFTVTQEYESGGNNLAGIASTARASSMEYELTANEHRSRIILTATGAAAGYPETITSTWQLYTNEDQKDIREHENALALGAGAVAAIESFIQQLKQFEDPEAAKAAYEEITAPLIDGGLWPPGSDEKKLLDLMLHGVTSFNVTGYAARATINLPFAYTGAIPGVATDSLMADIINDIPVGGPDDGINFKWGWRRMGTSRTFSADNRTEIGLEWWLKSWSLFLYSDVTDLPA